MEKLKELGNSAYASGNFTEALTLYSKAIQEPGSSDADLGTLFSNRSATHYCLGDYVTALLDAEKATKLAPTWGKGYARKGSALMLLNRYEEAHKAFSCGLVYDPKSTQIIKGIAECEVELAKSASEKRRQAIMSDDFDCILCMKLLFEPVTTPCGHSFCRACLVRALDHNSCCPLCRAVLHISPNHPFNVTLKSIIERNFPTENAARQLEQAELDKDVDSMPLFLLSVIAFPTQPFPLHIFEPRYRLMLRRCLEGQRRFGIVCCTQAQPKGIDIGCIVEIKNSHMLPDGRSFVETVATKRFRILNRWLQDGYVCGKVDIFRDEAFPDEQSREQAKQVAEQIRSHIVGLMNAHASNSSGVSDPGALRQLVESFEAMPALTPTCDLEQFSFWVAAHIPLPAPFSMEILQSRSTRERLQKLLEVIQTGNSQPSNCSVM